MKKRNTKKEGKEFEKYVANLCDALAYKSHSEEYRTIWKFKHNRGFSVTLHKDDQSLMFAVYGRFNNVHKEVNGSNQFSGKFNFLSLSSLGFAKIEFKDHLKIMTGMN